jgi:hypothetical protein
MLAFSHPHGFQSFARTVRQSKEAAPHTASGSERFSYLVKGTASSMTANY